MLTDRGESSLESCTFKVQNANSSVFPGLSLPKGTQTLDSYLLASEKTKSKTKEMLLLTRSVLEKSAFNPFRLSGSKEFD